MINFGVIGTSWITEEFIKCASLDENFKLTAVYSRSEEKVKGFAEKYKVTNIFTSLEEMAKSNVIDAVYIASPNGLHAAQSILFLNNKKHVLCEKAIASNVKELNAMIGASKNNGVLLMEAMRTTLYPNFKVIEENLHKLGKIRRYFASYCQYSSKYDAHKEGKHMNAFDPNLSNGSIMDIGVYCIHPLVKLFGLPEHIQATAVKLNTGVDGEGTLFVSYEDMDGVIIHSKIANSFAPAEIQGEAGTMIIDKIGNPEKVQIIYKDKTIEDLSVPQIKESMYYEAKEFIDLIKNNRTESEINSHKQSLMAMKVMEEARKQTGIVFPADK